MKQSERNSAFKSLIDSVAGFNPFSLKGSSFFEIAAIGLEIFNKVPGCRYASLFLLNPDDFEFYYKVSTSEIYGDSVKKTFQDLIQEGLIAKAINSCDILECESKDPTEETTRFLIVPLAIENGVIGICLLNLRHSISGEAFLLNLCRIFSNYFTLALHNFDLKKENENLKEITEQKIALRTNAIVQSTRELKTILDSVQIGIIIVDKATDQIEDANLAATNLIGTSKEKLIGVNEQTHFIFTDRRISTTGTKTNHEGLLKKRNGTLIPIIITIADISLSGKDYFIESFIDITERKKMEDDLYKAHFELEQKVEERTKELSKMNLELRAQISEKLKAEKEKLKLFWAIQQSQISIAITGLEGNTEYISPQFAETNNFRFEDVKGKISLLLKTDVNSPEELKILISTIKLCNKWHDELRSRNIGGEDCWNSSFVNQLENLSGEISGYLEAEDKINQLKKAEIALRVAKEKAEESERLKTRLLANMSHEFRTPLSGILGFSQILIDEIKDISLSDMAKDIFNSGKRLMDTLNGVLNLSQLETMDISSVSKVLNLSLLIEAAASRYSDLVKEKSLEFKVEIIRRNLFALVDEKLFYKALDCLVQNAIKFTSKGSITIIADAKQSEGDKAALIKVHDTGVGIDENNFDIIFEPFRQVSEGYNRNFEGVGLGLSIAQTIFGLMGGTIKVESTLLKGSTFIISIPLVEDYSVNPG